MIMVVIGIEGAELWDIRMFFVMEKNKTINPNDIRFHGIITILL